MMRCRALVSYDNEIYHHYREQGRDDQQNAPDRVRDHVAPLLLGHLTLLGFDRLLGALIDPPSIQTKRVFG